MTCYNCEMNGNCDYKNSKVLFNDSVVGMVRFAKAIFPLALVITSSLAAHVFSK